MNELTDSQLLQRYVQERSDPAFAELAHRYLDFIYSAALRMVLDPHLAEDVTQGVFIALAKSAPRLTERPALSGWLHRATLNIAAQTVRTIERRRAREQEAVMMNQLLDGEPEALWQQLAPQLDYALGDLNESDRDVLLLRYFQGKSAREMAQIVRTTEEAAQKRVSRAVERLRELLARRGVAVGASGLVVLISANAVHAAPAGLSATVLSAAGLAAAALQAPAFVAATKAVAMTTLQKTLIGATLALAAGTGIYEVHRAAQLSARNQALEQQQLSFAGQLQSLQGELNKATNQLADLAAENNRLKSGSDDSELLKLRGQIALLRTDSEQLAQLRAAITNDPAESAAKSWLDRVNKLKQRLQQIPDKRIPEMQFLSEQDWLRITSLGKFETDEEVRRALYHLREDAKQYFARKLGTALREYVAANAGQLPSHTSQLMPYFDPPVESALLERYQMLKTGAASQRRDNSTRDEMVLGESSPVDDEFDTLFQIGLYSFRSNGTGSIRSSSSGEFSSNTGWHYDPRYDLRAAQNSGK